jgi:uncharacterized protein YggU (UPF0235/DUF167 family)
MYVKVRVIAGAKAEKFEATSKDHFKAAVKEPAERNLANRRVVELVAAHFKIPGSRVRIVSGHRSPSKILSVPELRPGV